MTHFQRTLHFIRSHPLGSRHKFRAISNWLSWQLRSRLSRGPHIVPFVGNTKLLVTRGMHGATGNIYCGLHEFEDMGFVMHFLRAGELFVDVGANIGSYTILASGICGASTLAFEPAPSSADALLANIQLNGIDDLVRIDRRVLGRHTETVWLTRSLDCVNHVVTSAENEDAIEVQQICLDDVLQDELPTLLKIDVEGYELEVLAGATVTLSNPSLKAVIVEVNGSGKRYDQTDADVIETLREHGFKRVRYDPIARHIAPCEMFDSATKNALFVRDLHAARMRVVAAPPMSVMGRSV